MHYFIAKHIINRFACLLTATLIQISDITLSNQKASIAKVKSIPGSVESDLTMLLNGFFLVSCASFRNIVIGLLGYFRDYLAGNSNCFLVTVLAGQEKHWYSRN